MWETTGTVRGTWIWEWSGQEVIYDNWDGGEPNSGSDRCTEVVIKPGRVGKWNDVGCIRKYLFICEKNHY